MNRTCLGCKAFEYNSQGYSACSLKYKNRNMTPIEKCPKPKTTKQFVKLLSEVNK